MDYKYLIANIDREDSSYEIKLKLPRGKTIKIENIYFQYDWDEEGVYLVEWTDISFSDHKKMFKFFYDFNRRLSFLYRFNIGLVDDERISYLKEYSLNEEDYSGSNKNALNIKKFYDKCKSLEVSKKKEFDACINILNKSAYFNLELELEEEAYIYLYKIIEIIANNVVNSKFVENKLKELKNDYNLEGIIKKYLCEENGIANYPDIISTLKNKILERYNSAVIKIYHLNLNVTTVANLGDIDSIKEVVDIRNKLSHANPVIHDREKFNRVFQKIYKYVPELMCKYYISEDYKDIDCKPYAKPYAKPN